jgi:hypothetical protein
LSLGFRSAPGDTPRKSSVIQRSAQPAVKRLVGRHAHRVCLQSVRQDSGGTWRSWWRERAARLRPAGGGERSRQLVTGGPRTLSASSAGTCEDDPESGGRYSLPIAKYEGLQQRSEGLARGAIAS